MSLSSSPEQWRAGGALLAWNGRRLFAARHGAGPPVLALHAFPTASYDFARVVARLADQFEFFLLDYPGFGFSDKPRGHAYSLFEYADAAQAVCAHFGLERVALLAHDIGDSVALELLRRGRPAVERLCLLNGSVWSIPFTDWRLRLPQRLSLHPWLGPLISRAGLFRQATLRVYFQRIFARPLPPDELAAFWRLITNNDGAANYHRLLGYMPERWQHQEAWLAALAGHPAPLALIWGLADPVATPAVAEIIRARRPDAHYHPLAGVGHYPHWETPETVASVLAHAWGGRSTSST